MAKHISEATLAELYEQYRIIEEDIATSEKRQKEIDKMLSSSRSRHGESENLSAEKNDLKNKVQILQKRQRQVWGLI